MFNKSQIDFVRKELDEHKKISRNKCLKHFITRLGAIIKILQDEGYMFDSKPPSSGKTMVNGSYEKTRFGTDYVYYLIAKPL